MDPNREVATKADVANLRSAMKADVAELRSAMKADVADLRAEMKGLEERMQGRMDVQEQRIMDRTAGLIHDSETRLLQAFYGFAESNDRRVKQAEVNVDAVSGPSPR